MCKQFYTNRFKLIFVSRFLFCQLPEIGHNLGCLEGAWEVSGGFLSNPGQCQDAMVCKQLINIQLGSFFLDVFLHPASSDQPKCAIFWGVCRVSGGSLGCIWRTLDIIRGVRIQNQLIKVEFRSKNAKFQVRCGGLGWTPNSEILFSLVLYIKTTIESTWVLSKIQFLPPWSPPT